MPPAASGATWPGWFSRASRADPPSPLKPAGSTMRMRLLAKSAMQMLPARSSATSAGRLSVACRAPWLSPLLPAVLPRAGGHRQRPARVLAHAMSTALGHVNRARRVPRHRPHRSWTHRWPDRRSRSGWIRPPVLWGWSRHRAGKRLRPNSAKPSRARRGTGARDCEKRSGRSRWNRAAWIVWSRSWRGRWTGRRPRPGGHTAHNAVPGPRRSPRSCRRRQADPNWILPRSLPGRRSSRRRPVPRRSRGKPWPAGPGRRPAPRAAAAAGREW